MLLEAFELYKKYKFMVYVTLALWREACKCVALRTDSLMIHIDS